MTAARPEAIATRGEAGGFFAHHGPWALGIRLPRPSIDRSGQATVVETHGRHDPCVGIRATPIAEAMLALVLMDHALRHRAQCGDVVCPTPKIPGRARDNIAG